VSDREAESAPCPVCGARAGRTFAPGLWPSLIEEWELSQDEASSIDRREGESCRACGVHLRSMALGSALLRAAGHLGPLEDWVAARPSLKILEINRAGDLTPWLARLPNHRLVQFPDVDLHSLPFADGQWDLVVHSDTLEHVEDPVKALMECRRVLIRDGCLCFTIPIVPGRLTRRRDGMSPSYHGSEQDPLYRVVTEYGADFWASVLQAGFRELRMVVEQWPDALALIASSDDIRSALRPPESDIG